MYLDEVLKTLRMGLVSQCMMLEVVLDKEIDKVAGEYLPMQDHLAECTWAKHPNLNWGVKECLDYLEKLYGGLSQAFIHGQLAKSKGLGPDFEIAKIADMLWGSIYNEYPDDLVNCAKEVRDKVKEMTPKKAKNTSEACFEWKKKVLKEIKKICDKYEIDFPIYREWTIQEGYIVEWLNDIFEDINITGI